MRTFLISLALTILTNISYSQTIPEKIASEFFDKYKLGDTDKAIDHLFSYTPYAKDIEESLGDVKRQLKKTTSPIGKFYGADLLTTRTARPNLVMLTYLVRHDREPLVFNIIFYKRRTSGKCRILNTEILLMTN